MYTVLYFFYCNKFFWINQWRISSTSFYFIHNKFSSYIPHNTRWPKSWHLQIREPASVNWESPRPSFTQSPVDLPVTLGPGSMLTNRVIYQFLLTAPQDWPISVELGPIIPNQYQPVSPSPSQVPQMTKCPF